MLFAACILVFASAVRDLSVTAGHSRLAAYLVGFMALSAAGVGVFAYPHPLHNIFGISELIGYQAPLVFALTWRRDPRCENCRCRLVDFLCPDLGRYPFELELT